MEAIQLLQLLQVVMEQELAAVEQLLMEIQQQLRDQHPVVVVAAEERVQALPVLVLQVK